MHGSSERSFAAVVFPCRSSASRGRIIETDRMARQRKTNRRRLSAPKGATAVGKASSTTGSGVALDVVATRDPKADAYWEGLGFPGDPPFTRGIHPTMYRGRLWTMRQYAGFGSAAESNRRVRYLLSQGTTGLSGAFDLPTQMGDDPDDPLVRGEVGKGGVPIA